MCGTSSFSLRLYLRTNGWTDKWTDKWMDKWMDKWTDGWTNGWTNGQMDGQMRPTPSRILHKPSECFHFVTNVHTLLKSYSYLIVLLMKRTRLQDSRFKTLVLLWAFLVLPMWPECRHYANVVTEPLMSTRWCCKYVKVDRASDSISNTCAHSVLTMVDEEKDDNFDKIKRVWSTQFQMESSEEYNDYDVESYKMETFKLRVLM